MQRLRRAVAVAMAISVTGCSAHRDAEPAAPAPTAFTAPGLTCDQDRSSSAAKDTIERIGGLVADDFVVRFAQSTRAGVVALVEGDTATAYEQLSRTYGVAVVAPIEEADDDRAVTGFQQVQRLVASACVTAP